MKANELRSKSVDELKQEHLLLLKEQFNLRMQKSSGQLSKTHEVRRVRKTIAKVLTVLNEKMGANDE